MGNFGLSEADKQESVQYSFNFLREIELSRNNYKYTLARLKTQLLKFLAVIKIKPLARVLYRKIKGYS